MIITPFYLENMLSLSPGQVGLLMAVVPISLIIAAPISGSLSDRIGAWKLVSFGLGVLCLGYFAVTFLNIDTVPWEYILYSLPIGIGMGIFDSPNNSTAMGSLEKGYLGIGSSLLALSYNLGYTLGIGVLGGFWSTRAAYYAITLPQDLQVSQPLSAQMHGLWDMFYITVGIVFIALVLSLVNARKQNRQTLPITT